MPTARQIITEAVFLHPGEDIFNSLAVSLSIDNHKIIVEYERRELTKSMYDPAAWYDKLSDPELWDSGNPVDMSVEQVLEELERLGVTQEQILIAALEILKENNTLWYKPERNTEGA